METWDEVKKFFGSEDKKTPKTDKVAKPKVQKNEIKTKGFFESISAGITLKGIGKGIGIAFNLASRFITISLGYVGKLLTGLRSGAIDAFNAISSGISKAGANIQSVWNGVFNWFSSKFDWLSGIFDRVSSFASSIAGMGANALSFNAPKLAVAHATTIKTLPTAKNMHRTNATTNHINTVVNIPNNGNLSLAIIKDAIHKTISSSTKKRQTHFQDKDI